MKLYAFFLCGMFFCITAVSGNPLPEKESWQSHRERIRHTRNAQEHEKPEHINVPTWAKKIAQSEMWYMFLTSFLQGCVIDKLHEVVPMDERTRFFLAIFCAIPRVLAFYALQDEDAQGQKAGDKALRYLTAEYGSSLLGPRVGSALGAEKLAEYAAREIFHGRYDSGFTAAGGYMGVQYGLSEASKVVIRQTYDTATHIEKPSNDRPM